MALFKVNGVVRLLCLKQIALVASWQGRPLMHYRAKEDVWHVAWGLANVLFHKYQTVNMAVLTSNYVLCRAHVPAVRISPPSWCTCDRQTSDKATYMHLLCNVVFTEIFFNVPDDFFKNKMDFRQPNIIFPSQMWTTMRCQTQSWQLSYNRTRSRYSSWLWPQEI